MNDLRYIFIIILLSILILPLFTMWAISFLLGDFAKLLDNIVRDTCDGLEEELNKFSDE
nr:MAG TPA: hypothetical protein [Bacteriophage sp.]